MYVYGFYVFMCDTRVVPLRPKDPYILGKGFKFTLWPPRHTFIYSGSCKVIKAFMPIFFACSTQICHWVPGLSLSKQAVGAHPYKRTHTSTHPHTHTHAAAAAQGSPSCVLVALLSKRLLPAKRPRSIHIALSLRLTPSLPRVHLKLPYQIAYTPQSIHPSTHPSSRFLLVLFHSLHPYPSPWWRCINSVSHSQISTLSAPLWQAEGPHSPRRNN